MELSRGGVLFYPVVFFLWEGSMKQKKIIYNGKLVDEGTVRFSLEDTDMLYGYGCYETLKVRSGLLYFPEEHVARLIASADAIGFKHNLNEAGLIPSLRNFVVSLNLDNSNLRMVVIGHEGRNADWYILSQPAFFPPVKAKTNGVDCLLFFGERQLPRAKSLSMLLSTIAYRAACERDCYDALLVNRHEQITEGTRTNVFYVEKDQPNLVYTPPASQVLSGITRKTFLHALDDAEMSWIEEPLTLEQAFSGRFGMLISSTSTTLVPVARIYNPEGDLWHTLPVFNKLQTFSTLYDSWLESWEREARSKK